MSAAGIAKSAAGRDGNAWLRVRRLLVVRADNIGDVVMTGPALRALRELLPDAHITLLASPAGAEAAPLLRPWLDDVITWRVLWQDLGRLPFDPSRERALIERLRRGAFDGVLVMTSFSQSPYPAALIAWLAGIGLRAGASREHADVLTHPAPFGPFGRHQAERNLALVAAALGTPCEDDALGIRVPARARASARALLHARGLYQGARYWLWNPWASAPARTYPPERGAEAAKRIYAATALPVVITGHARDAAEARQLADRIGRAALNLAGATSVVELAALVAGAELVVSSHTSVMHLAEALRVPAVILFSGTDMLSQWAPRHSPHVILTRPVPCSPCYAIRCPIDLACLAVHPDEIVEAALGLLDAGREANAERAAAGGRRCNA